MGMRRVGAWVCCWMLAEPVPVLRPGVWEMGVDGRDGAGVASGTGRTKSGLNLCKGLMGAEWSVE